MARMTEAEAHTQLVEKIKQAQPGISDKEASRIANMHAIKNTRVSKTVGNILSGKNPIPESQLNPDQKKQLSDARTRDAFFTGKIGTGELYSRLDSSMTQFEKGSAQRTQRFGQTAQKQGQSTRVKQATHRAEASGVGAAVGSIQKDGTNASSRGSKVSKGKVGDFKQSNVLINTPTTQQQREGKVKVTTPDGKERVFKDRATAKKFVSRTEGSYVNEVQGPVKPEFHYTVQLQDTIGDKKTSPVITPYGNLEYVYDTRQQSSFGKTVEPTLQKLDEFQQTKPDNPILSSLKTIVDPVAGFAKSGLAGLASLDNIGQDAATYFFDSPVKKQTKIPDTFVGVIASNVIEGKQKDVQVKEALAYVQSRGVQSTIGELGEIGLAPWRSPVKAVTILNPSTGLTAGKVYTFAGKPIISTTAKITSAPVKTTKPTIAQSIKSKITSLGLGNVKPTATDIDSIIRFEVAQGSKAQASFNRKLILADLQKTKLDPKIEARILELTTNMERRARKIKDQVITPGGTEKAVEPLDEGVQSQTLIKVNKALQNKKDAKSIFYGWGKPLGQIGGSYAESRQVLPKYLKIPHDMDVVVKNTEIAQAAARYTVQQGQTTAKKGQSFVVSGPRGTKTAIGKNIKTGFGFVAQNTKDVFWHGTDLESAMKIRTKGFSLKGAGKQTKHYLLSKTSKKYAESRASQISPTGTIFLTPNYKLASRFAETAATSTKKSPALIRTELKEGTKIKRIKEFDPEKVNLEHDIQLAKQQGYKGILKPIGGPGSNLELILFDKSVIKSRQLLTKVPFAKSQKGLKKYAEFLDDKDLVEGNKEAVQSGILFGRKLKGKGIKDPKTGEVLEKLSEQQSKRATSVLTYHKETGFHPLDKRLEKDIVMGYRDWVTTADNLLNVKRLNPVREIQRRFLGKQQVKDAEEFKQIMTKKFPQIDWDMDIVSEVSASSKSVKTDGDSITSIANKIGKTPRNTLNIIQTENIKKDNKSFTIQSSPKSKPTISSKSYSSSITTIPKSKSITSSLSYSTKSFSSKIPKPTSSSTSLVKISRSSSSLTSLRSSKSPSITSMKSPSPKSPSLKSPKSPTSPKSPGSPKNPITSKTSPSRSSISTPKTILVKTPRKVYPTVVIPWKHRTQKEKPSPKKPRVDFLGNTRVAEISGFRTKKTSIEYGSKTQKLFDEDLKKTKRRSKRNQSNISKNLLGKRISIKL